MRLLEPFLWVASWIPSLTPSIMRLTFNYGGIFPAYNRVDVSYGVFIPPPYFPNNNQVEMAVDLVHCVEALKELKTVVETLSIPVNLITEVCTIRGYWKNNLPICNYSLVCPPTLLSTADLSPFFSYDMQT